MTHVIVWPIWPTDDRWLFCPVTALIACVRFFVTKHGHLPPFARPLNHILIGWVFCSRKNHQGESGIKTERAGANSVAASDKQTPLPAPSPKTPSTPTVRLSGRTDDDRLLLYQLPRGAIFLSRPVPLLI